jgi:hypothetical protein
MAVAVSVPAAQAATLTAKPVPVTAAATAATNGLISYSCLGHTGSGQNGWVVATSTGANKVFTPWTHGAFGGSAQWSADGTEMVHSASFTNPSTGTPQRLSVMLSEADGSYPWQLTTDAAGVTSTDSNPSWAPSGRQVAFTRRAGGASDVRVAYTTGVSNPGVTASSADTADISVFGDQVYVTNGSDIMFVPSSGGAPVKLATGMRPRFARDGLSLAYVDASTQTTIHTMDLTGGHDTVAGTAPTGPITDFAWSPDATKWLVAGPKQVWVEDAGTGTNRVQVGGSECAGGSPQVSWQPVPTAPAQVVRMAGPDRVGTSIAVSRASYPTDGTALAVVLADSRHFPDALAGTPLAAKEHGPLLLTDGSKSTLDPRVMAEIKRVLKATSSPVYLLGGTASLSSGIEAELTSAGYTALQRFAGTDRYDTALQIATFSEGFRGPHYMVLATGTDFPDGLAAGAAAALHGGVLLLTDGSRLTAGVQQFIQQGIGWGAPVVTVGGLAAQAYPDAGTSCVGADRYQTSELVAEKLFDPPHEVALATGTSFPDALSGGAYAAAHLAPLLLAPPSLTATGAVPAFLHAWSSTIDRADIFGGTGVVPSTVEQQLGPIIGLTSTYSTVTPN